jgi:hypothetical protein
MNKMTHYQKYWRPNKYGNIHQTYNGYTYASKFEAEYAAELDLRVKGKDIEGWERQVKIPIEINNYHICNYYVDFLIYHNDGSKELVEIKGMETDLWRIKRKLLEAIYLPKHPEYNYTVIKRSSVYNYKVRKK